MGFCMIHLQVTAPSEKALFSGESFAFWLLCSQGALSLGRGKPAPRGQGMGEGSSRGLCLRDEGA